MVHMSVLNELLAKQLKSIPSDKKLQYADLKRISKYISTSMFDENQCCTWEGYITNTNNLNKGVYINFFFRGNKVALHRLLYSNFVGPLSSSEYLKFTCKNKGKCCNVMHLQKFQYTHTSKSQKPKKKSSQKPKVDETQVIHPMPESLTITFD